MTAEDGNVRDETEPALGGKHEAERALEALHTSTFGWALTCCGFDRDVASDVLQSSYLRILEGKARFNGHSSFRTWVFGVVRRTAAEHRRRSFVRELALVRWARREVASNPCPTPEATSEQERTATYLRSLLARLSARQRELLHLVFYQELSIEEAAETLSISIGTARIHYERGKAALREQMAARGAMMTETHHGPAERIRPRDARAVPGCTAGGREVSR